MKENIVLVGAGSAMFTRGLLADMIRQRWEGSVALVDIDPEALQTVEPLAAKMIAATRSPLKLSAHTDICDALPGATAVICTIGVGGRRAWEQDVFIPRRYGIFQPVGDTTMPGGTSRALRMIPAMVTIAEHVLELAPDALFFNYGNPMSPVCRGVHKATGAKMVGLCHGITHVTHYLAHVLDCPAQSLRHTATGINHLTWFTELRCNGEDVMPRLRDIARQRTADPMSADEPFSWELMNLFGVFPAVLDRHVTEFFPQLFRGEKSYYGKTLGIEAFSFEGTIRSGDQIFAQMQDVAASAGPLPKEHLDQMSGEHEQVVDIIESIRGDKARIYSANLPNVGQVPNLPRDAVLECPAVADAAGLRPIACPALPAGVAGTLATRFQWVETVVEAALEGSIEKFIQALVIDGAVTSIGQARELAADLLQAQAAHLPRFPACVCSG